jgi:hypothetical protein
LIIPHEIMKVYPFHKFNTLDITCKALVMALQQRNVTRFT